jgi:hypothetical protein
MKLCNLFLLMTIIVVGWSCQNDSILQEELTKEDVMQQAPQEEYEPPQEIDDSQ